MTTKGFDTKRWARWVGTFVGFPLAGLAARAVAGNIDTVSAAVIGGLVGGAVLGDIQVRIGGIRTLDRARWVAATAAGFAAGLALGAAAVGYRTDTASLVGMGALTGAGVGLAQASSIAMRPVDRILWAVSGPALWAGAWLMTSQIIVDAERQHAVFGLPSGLVISTLAGVLHVLRRQPEEPAAVPVGSLARPVAS